MEGLMGERSSNGWIWIGLVGVTKLYRVMCEMDLLGPPAR